MRPILPHCEAAPKRTTEPGIVDAHLRAAAARDIEDAVVHHRDEAGTDVALGFIESLNNAIAQLCDFPRSGSLRLAFELGIPDMRSWPLQRFPYVVFYTAEDSFVDIWRVLHARRDLAAFEYDVT